jgi:hypothetical protein
LATGKLKITDKVTSTIENITDDNLQLRKKYKERVSILVYFFSIDSIDVAIAKKIALEYVWDNFLSLSEQLRLLANPDDTIKNVAKIHMLQSGSIKANRFLNYDSGQIDYICADGRPCSIAVADSFKAAADPLKTLKADTKTTGFFYGFMAAKKGTLVFKTLTPHPVGGVPNRGQECAYDSAPTEKRERLVSLGEFLGKKGLPNLELTDSILKQAPQIKKNASCYCILLELVLRYMDVLQIDKKKWFYRSIESKFAGHKFVALAGKTKAKTSKKTSVPLAPLVPVNEDDTPPPAPPPIIENEDNDEDNDDDVPPPAAQPLAEEENNENEIVNLPPMQVPNLNKEKAYKGNWIHEGTVYQRDGLDIFKNGDYVGEYDPTTNTIDTETIFTG